MEIIQLVNNDLNCKGIIEVKTDINKYNLRLVPIDRNTYEIAVHLESRKVMGSFREFIQLENNKSIEDGFKEIKNLLSDDYIFNKKVVSLYHASQL